MASENEWELFAPLEAAVSSDDFPGVVSAAEAILRELPGDEDAINAKLVALIKQELFEDALKFLHAEKSLRNRKFERCYCLFRLNRLDEAFELLADASTPAELELRAQVLYRMEQYKDAITAYRELMQKDEAENEETFEHATNLVAAMVGHQVASRAAGGGGALSIGEPPEGEGFEQLYNTSCLMLARSRFDEALEAIDAAIDDCREVVMSEPGVTEDQVEEELLLLRVQRGAVLHALGRSAEASKELNQALNHHPDPTLGAIAAANILAVNRDRNVFDSRKKLPLVASADARAKMTVAQRLLVSKNHILLLMLMGHTEPLKKQLDTFAAEFPDSDLPCLVRASNLMRRKNTDMSKDCLHQYIEANPDRSDEVRLVLAQTHITDAALGQAVEQLQALKSLQHSPGLTGVLMELMSLQERHGEASSALNDAIAFWEAQDTPQAKTNVVTLLRAGATYNTVHRKYRDAATLYQKILERDRQSAIALIELIKCYAEFDLDEAEQYAEQLPPVSSNTQGLDVDLLERASKRRVPRPVPTAAAATAAAAAVTKGQENAPVKSPLPDSELAAVAAAAAAERPKRKRKKRVGKKPKDYNPNIPPDPERWLPRYERSEYKKRHKKKNALHHAIQRGPQGSSKAAADEAAERAAAAEKDKADKAAKAEAAAAAQLAQAAAKRKKKKGGKKKK